MFVGSVLGRIWDEYNAEDIFLDIINIITHLHKLTGI